MKKILCVLTIFMLTFSASWSQEFLLHEETFTWTKNADVCGGYHYWYNTGSAPSTNWKSPYDYQYGTYYFRFEVIDQPSSEPFTLNMCIWTEFISSPMSWKEQCWGFSPVLAGDGSTVTYSSPVTYALNGIPIDWTDLSKLWRLGNPLYIDGKNLGNGPYCTDNPETWALVDSYLPLTMRITIVAVAQGYTFSGWSNYTGGGCTPVKQTTPTYGIDYTNHTTNKVVPSTDEYSYSSNMSGAVSGTGVKLALTAAQDVYFRTKASGSCLLASDIQYLDVPSSWSCTPAKQATPTYGIDYTNERTDKVVPSTDEYSYYSNMSSAASGTGGRLTLVPGQTVYFRTKALDACILASDIQTLVAPSRPAKPSYTIDFSNEKTVENVNSTIEYSTSSSYTNPVSGTGVPISLTPGGDLYFWVKVTSSSFYSEVTHLAIPSRPAAPSSFTVDFINEKTTQVIPSGMEYSTSASFTSSTSGAGNTVSLTPGQDLYIRYKATASTFASPAFVLDVPARPAAPVATIDYDQEKTVESFSSTIEYSTSVSMSGAVSGSGAAITLTPGTDLYFRQKPTASSFISAITHLAVPARPSVPSVTIDYALEVTSAIPSNMAWSTNSSGTSAVSGTNAPVALTPGTDLYIWVEATASSFASTMQTLDVPARPAAPVVTIDYIMEETAEAIPSTIEYSLNAAMTSPVSGINTVLALTPGSDLYLRYKTTASSFASALLHLTVPARPAAPLYTIDFGSVKTNENVPSAEEYTTHSDMTGATSGAGVKIDLSPGVIVYFRIKSTASSFASLPYELIVPLKPEILSQVGDTIEGNFFVVSLDFHTTSTDGFDLSDLEITNAELTDMGQFIIEVTPESPGQVTVKIVADALNTGNFASETLSTYFKGKVSALREVLSAEGSLRVYPAPVRDMLKVETIRNLSLPLEIRILDCSGMVALQQEMFTTQTTIDMNGYPAGLYILLAVDANGNALTCKIIKQ